MEKNTIFDHVHFGLNIFFKITNKSFMVDNYKRGHFLVISYFESELIEIKCHLVHTKSHQILVSPTHL